ncbi:MAG TPA: GDP-mannose 4,6-dehydratase [Magnetospirillum sp.]|nr:GDP-mannose 4,6-dehydratase [Magnetospirillum sp.]
MTTPIRVAVIGSTAFSASDFIDLLLDDGRFQVLGISRSPETEPTLLPHLRHGGARYGFRQLHLVTQMAEVLAALDDFQPTYVVNYAAQGEVGSSFLHPEAHFATNTMAMVALTNALKDRTWLGRYVHISTPEIYGSCDGAVSEDQPINPSSPYAASKAAADLFTGVLHRSHGFPVTWIRATNVYGPHQQLYRIIPRTVIYSRLGRTLRLDGGGQAVKSYIHIRDVSRGTLAAMLHGLPGRVYHLSPDQGVSIRAVVESVCRLMGRDMASLVEIGPERPGQDRAYILDSSRARSELGWAPGITFEAGLKQVVEWIDRDWSRIRELDLNFNFKV